MKQLHDGLRTLKATMQDALNEGDIDTMLANVDEQVVLTTMNGDVLLGKDGIREYFVKMMTGPDRIVDRVTSNFEVDDLSIIHGGDTAVAFGDTQDHYVLTDGSDFDVEARWSSTMLLQGDRWVIASFHYSTNMFDNAILNAQRQFLILCAVVLILLASAISFFFGRRVGRNSV